MRPNPNPAGLVAEADNSNTGIVVSLLFVWSYWLVFEFSIFGGSSVMISADNAEQTVPSLMVRNFSDGLAPLWDRYAAGGIDDIAGADYAILNILLFKLVPGWAAHALHLSLQILVANFSIYFLVRRALHFSVAGSIAAAVAYTGTIHPYLVSSVESFFPTILLALTYFLENPRSFRRILAVLGSILLVAWTGYFSRFIPYVSVFVFSWFLFVAPPKRWKLWLPILLVCLLLPVIRARDVLSLIAVVPLSHTSMARTITDSNQVLASFSMESLVSNWTEATAVILLLFTIILTRRITIWLTSIVLLGVLSSGLYFYLFTLMQELLQPFAPFVSGYRFQYFTGLKNLTYSVAIGYSITKLVPHVREVLSDYSELNRKRIAFTLIALVAIGITATTVKTKYGEAFSWVTQGSFTRNFQSPVLRKLSEEIAQMAYPVRVEGYQIPPAYLNGYGLETAGGYTPVYYRRYYEYWGKIVEPWAQGLKNDDLRERKRFDHRRSKLGGNQLFRGDRLALYPREYSPEVNFDGMYSISLLALANVGYIVSRDELSSQHLEEVRRPKRSWSSLSHLERTRQNIRSNFTGHSDLYIYKLNAHVPRIFSVSSIREVDGRDDLLDQISKSRVPALVTEMLVDRGDLPTDATSREKFFPIKILLEKYSNDEIILRVTNPEGPSLLSVMNTYSPFWEARIDGVKQQLFPAYWAFWGLRVPQGASKIVFKYVPPYRKYWG